MIEKLVGVVNMVLLLCLLSVNVDWQGNAVTLSKISCSQWSNCSHWYFVMKLNTGIQVIAFKKTDSVTK